MKKSVKGIFSLALTFTLICVMLIPASAASATSADTKAAALKQPGRFEGVSAAEPGTDNTDSDMYLTCMLRVPGCDAAGDAYGSAVELVNEPNPVSVSVTSFEALKTALSGGTVKAITIDSVGAPVIVTGELTIPNDVTVTVNPGNDFYVEGILTNNGTLNVMGADSIRKDFINYSVMAVRNGGKVINNGAVNLLSAVLSDTSDLGPVGGQLRIFDGSFTNNGSVALKAGAVNTHGGMLAVIEGLFTNNSIIIVDGFQIDIAGTLMNSKGAVVINNSYISTEKGGTFTNNGTLSGNPVVQ